MLALMHYADLIAEHPSIPADGKELTARQCRATSIEIENHWPRPEPIGKMLGHARAIEVKDDPHRPRHFELDDDDNQILTLLGFKVGTKGWFAAQREAKIAYSKELDWK